MAKVVTAGDPAMESVAGELDLVMEAAVELDLVTEATGEVDLETEVMAMAGATMASLQEASSLEDLPEATATPRTTAKAGAPIKALKVRALPATKVGVLVKVAALKKVALATLVTAGVLETPAVREAPAAPATTKVGVLVKVLLATPAALGAVEATIRALLTVAAMAALARARPASTLR